MTVNVYFLAAVITPLTVVCAAIGYLLNKGRQAVEDAVTEAMRPFDTRLTVMETKMDVFWKDVAFDAAKILHHPEASREHIDGLLDKFLQGKLTDAEVAELKQYLEIVRDWEPGRRTAFKVYPGEQVAAAILLRTFEHARNQGRRNGR